MNNYNISGMKRGLIVLFAVIFLTTHIIEAQTPAREKLDAYRIAFFTKRLNLTSQEAEKFWPVYNEFQNKKNEIQKERVNLNRNVNQNELNMSEKEMIDAGDKFIAFEVQEANLAQEYHNKFKAILSPAKVIRLYQAENQYRMFLLQELRQNQENKNNLQKRGPGGMGSGLNMQSGSSI
jgi:hypothetical protein